MKIEISGWLGESCTVGSFGSEESLIRPIHLCLTALSLPIHISRPCSRSHGDSSLVN